MPQVQSTTQTLITPPSLESPSFDSESMQQAFLSIGVQGAQLSYTSVIEPKSQSTVHQVTASWQQPEISPKEMETAMTIELDRMGFGLTAGGKSTINSGTPIPLKLSQPNHQGTISNQQLQTLQSNQYYPATR